MNRLTLLISLIVLLAAALPVAWSARRMRDASDALDAAKRMHVDTVSLAKTKRELETRESRIGLAARPTDDVQTPIINVLENLALDTGLFRGIEETENQALSRKDESGPSFRRQSMIVRLKQTALRNHGAILAGWREREPEWTPSRIVLTASPPRGGRSAQMTALYAMDMTLTSIYLEDQGVVE